MPIVWYLVLLLLQALFCNVKTAHVTGEWNGDKFKFLQKFAIINGNGRQIYFYGNFSRDRLSATLAFVPSDVWKRLNDEITGTYSDSSCTDIMRPLCNIDSIVNNYTRPLPCNECQGEHLVPNSQITYSVNKSTQFYYAYMSSCICVQKDTTEQVQSQFCCTSHVPQNYTWMKSVDGGSISYDVWFVSGDPCTSNHNAFTYQFSFHEHGILIVLIIIITLYVILLPFHLVGYTCLLGKCQMPNFVRIFTVALALELFGLIFILTHYSIYANDGKGVQVLYDLGFFFEDFADCVLLLIILLIAKGYRITISVIRRKRILIAIWMAYFAAVVTYTMWALVSSNVK